MRTVLAPLLGVLLAVPGQAGVAVRPVLAPTLPGAGLPTAVIAPKLTLTSPLTAPLLPSLSIKTPTLPAVATPHPIPLPQAGEGIKVIAAQPLEAVAAVARTPTGPSPAFAPAIGALFDGAAKPSWGPVLTGGMPVRNGISHPHSTSLRAPAADAASVGAFRGDLQGDQGAVAEPGSVFGWRAWDKAPTHGLPFVDRWIARSFGHTAEKPGPGFEFRGAPRRSDARAFLYGEKHSDKALVAENMAELARDMDPVRGGMVLVEGYLGPELFGTEAVMFLERRGLNADLLAARDVDFSSVRVRGWDDVEAHDASTPLVLRHHMELLALNSLTYDGKGLLYYPRLAAQAWRTLKAFVAMRKAALGLRNVSLDRSLGAALASSKETGRTVHVIAGSEHLLEKPDWLSAPLGAFKLRRSLSAVLSDVPYWARKPPDSR